MIIVVIAPLIFKLQHSVCLCFVYMENVKHLLMHEEFRLVDPISFHINLNSINIIVVAFLSDLHVLAKIAFIKL